jgi:hypothetical protein
VLAFWLGSALSMLYLKILDSGHTLNSILLCANLKFGPFLQRSLRKMFGLFAHVCILTMFSEAAAIRAAVFLRGDLIQMYKMFHGIDEVDLHDFFSFSQTNMTRNSEGKVFALGRPLQRL